MTRNRREVIGILAQVVGAAGCIGSPSFEVAEHRGQALLRRSGLVGRAARAEKCEDDLRQLMIDVLKACIAELEKR
jgi:hypothetical protein